MTYLGLFTCIVFWGKFLLILQSRYQLLGNRVLSLLPFLKSRELTLMIPATAWESLQGAYSQFYLFQCKTPSEIRPCSLSGDGISHTQSKQCRRLGEKLCFCRIHTCSSAKRQKIQYSAGQQSPANPGRKKGVNRAGEDLLVLKGMVHVVIAGVSVRKVPLNDVHTRSSQNLFLSTTAQNYSLVKGNTVSPHLHFQPLTH